MRAAYDSNPKQDPSSRNGGGGGGGSGMYRGGGGVPQGFGGFQGDINPEDLFNAFFGGGGGFGQRQNVFTFGGPGGFQTHYGGRPRQRTQQAPGAQGDTSPLTALIPIFILLVFALVSILPNILSNNVPDPSYSFEASSKLSEGRRTYHWGVEYFVEPKEWEGSGVWGSVPIEKRGGGREGAWSGELRGFERGVENVYVRRLQNECENFESIKQQRINQEAGFFGFGADFDKIRELRATKSESCEQLKKWGVTRQHGVSF